MTKDILAQGEERLARSRAAINLIDEALARTHDVASGESSSSANVSA